jgi:hypothetical protein
MSNHGRDPEKGQVRRSLINETTRNIDWIAKGINEGKFADKELMIKLINRMIAFLNEFVKPKAEVKDGHGIQMDAKAEGVSTPSGEQGTD